jgi:hypothetical protein
MTHKKKNKQKGGDVIGASIDLVNSLRDLGNTIFNEIHSITNIESDINNAASPSPGTPNVINGPPPFNQPGL